MHSFTFFWGLKEEIKAYKNVRIMVEYDINEKLLPL